MSGNEKLKPLVITNSENPRCFKSIVKSNLPVYHRHNRKAWMDSVIFNEWLTKWNNHLKTENRKILLFLDNFSGHKIDETRYENIKIIFFPANCTSKLQPLDQEIIHAFKVKYRTDIARERLQAIEYGSTAPVIDVLSSIYKIKRSWDAVTPTTIKNCFRKAGFNGNFLFGIDDDQSSDEQILEYQDLAIYA